METHIKKGKKNIVVVHLSRINDRKTKEFPISDYFPYDILISFLRDEAPRYAYLADYLDEESPDNNVS